MKKQVGGWDELWSDFFYTPLSTHLKQKGFAKEREFMRIPKRFKLHGATIRVEFDKELLHKDDARGLAIYREDVIRLQPNSNDNPFPDTHMEQTFLHELVHFIYSHAEYEDDRKDEVKVQRVSRLLHQALTTMEYD